MTYQYKCPYCNKKFDIERKVADYRETEECPNCSAESQRVYTPIGTVFNTGGFYCIDNRKENT